MISRAEKRQKCCAMLTVSGLFLSYLADQLFHSNIYETMAYQWQHFFIGCMFVLLSLLPSVLKGRKWLVSSIWAEVVTMTCAIFTIHWVLCSGEDWLHFNEMFKMQWITTQQHWQLRIILLLRQYRITGKN